jgi:hypothetical protein
MPDTRPVELVLQLPSELADSVEEVRRRDPEYLSRVIRYGLVRRAIYRELSRSTDTLEGAAQS